MSAESPAMIEIQYFPTSFGELVLGTYQEQLCLCDWKQRKQRTKIDKRLKGQLATEFIEKDNPVLAEAVHQLTEYLSGERKTFDLPLFMVGSDFQQSVWKELLNIPYGTTMTYLALSEKIGDRNAIRAVATANGANAMSIVIPCHRVIGSDGSLTGYAGGLEAKKGLLELEGILQQNQLEIF